MRKFYFRGISLVFICIAGLFWGCNVVNPHEQTPTYVHIDSFHFIGNPLVHATTSHQITTVWAYYNNNPIGVFDLPCTFPVITNGNTSGVVELSPGIVVNGLNNLLSGYPFYKFDTFTLVSQPGKVVNRQPVTEFFSDVKITNISDFESGVNFFLNVGNIPMSLIGGDSLVFEGHNSGTIYLTNVGDSSVDSSNSFVIPSGAAFIEFNYKSDLQFAVGLQANEGVLISSTPYYLAGIQPSDHWQKFYLSVADFAAQYKGTSYNLYIKTSLPAGMSKGRLLLDNIQLVTF